MNLRTRGIDSSAVWVAAIIKELNLRHYSRVCIYIYTHEMIRFREYGEWI